ncbi:DUF4238 domain-containing protein (plasmid) [Kitasatospora purpeofusca]|uniref:DUF4238 domain-containing protein n=1 Tax=Kitasatospora purpeofusca TaxID=67352 RepID=UPI002E11F53B|nr:DUF4238 domain-containing protein [Kitasatospora purpeofusca]
MMSEPRDTNRLFVEAKRLAALGEPPVHRQHVVSKVLLKQFTKHDPRSGVQLLSLDLDYPQRRPVHRGPGGCGVVEDFVAFASQSLERVWGSTEDRLPDVFTALDNGIDSLDAALAKVLLDTLALHLVRSHTYRDVHLRTFDRPYALVFNLLMNDWQGRLRAAVLREKGLHVVGREGLEYYATELLQPTVDLFQNHGMLRVRIEEVYGQVRSMIAGCGVRILTSPHGQEFLIGDVPAFTARIEPDGLRLNVAVAEATTAVMPLGRRHALALARPGVDDTVFEPLAAQLNQLQVQQARSKVFMHPDSGLDAYVRRHAARLRAVDRQGS